MRVYDHTFLTRALHEMGAPRPRIAVDAWAGEGHSTRRLALFYDRVVAFEPVERLHKDLVQSLLAEGYENVLSVHADLRGGFSDVAHTIDGSAMFLLRSSEEIGAVAELPYPIVCYVEDPVGPFDLRGRTHRIVREEHRFVVVSR